ncbi:trna pseudouridine synthase d : tRNA pseudouridine synthase D OS=Planctomyces maris DSM 8797 GN=truD PE=3 SV=1: TruD [Gemmataceae bacterium]|nr:trna pseudouridine synthase d : tRNA pseudouridine synthase D OS=Planctomyces maris DSM 8797 GN=truD PE=3 SV=1: TruD [Gemmataceae bacterium]VTU00658.1 trna pseudouridine synthase d : tRNA pseudouridine synthase D OS=Planctomyces maris DSM 8797 GN=truD PE=3 SV=1: TruD [Gemmataceae bacterium]
MQHAAMTPPMFTPDLPGVGGRIRARDEDFEVEEVPSYEPSGAGDHLYLWVEKRGVAPEFFARTIAQKLQVSPGAIGTAGLKDRHAVTRQWVSVPKECAPHVGRLDGDGVRVLKSGLHTNKLKPGHLRGNRFRILVRDADRTVSADAVLDRIRAQGMPNFYGPQRFGRDGSTVDLGMQCLAGRAPRRIRPFLFRFALSAVQSLLFNDYLGRRLRDGLFRTVLDGDAMAKWPAGGMFIAKDVAAEQARFDARETVTAGPMFGKKTYPTEGAAAEREAAVLSDNKLSPAAFGGFGKLVLGTRRHNLVYLDDLAAAWEPDGLRLSFTLPAGSYATVLLREVMKTDVADDAASPDDGGEDEQ